MSNPILIVVRKEFADYITSKKFVIVMGIFVLLLAASFASSPFQAVKIPFSQVVQSIVPTLSLAAPLFGIALGYDAVSGEREKGTLKLLLARPLFRENIIFGKIISSVIGLSFSVTASTLLAIGIAVTFLGVTPTVVDISRLSTIMLLTLLLALCFYGITLFFSTILSRSSRSMILSIVILAVFGFMIPFVASFAASAVVGQQPSPLPFLPSSSGGSQNNADINQTASILYSRTQSEILLISPTNDYILLAQQIANPGSGQTAPDLGGSAGDNATTPVSVVTPPPVVSPSSTVPAQPTGILDVLASNISSLGVMLAYVAIFTVLPLVFFIKREERQ